jgi:endoglucanase
MAVQLQVVYVSGRKRPAGEMNGKSGNINNCCSQIYPKGTKIPTNEVVCIFDADQVPVDDECMFPL